MDLNGLNVDEEESQDEEQEWKPAAAEFMVQLLRIIHSEAGNTIVASDERHSDGYNNDAGLRYLFLCWRINHLY